MNQQSLIESLVMSAGPQVPGRADVLELQQLSIDDLRARMDRFLSMIGKDTGDDNGNDCKMWKADADQTTVELANGARAVAYHASGSLRYTSGMPPLSALFPRVEAKDVLTKRVIDMAQKLRFDNWCDKKDRIAFERLFQVKAQGADKAGKLSQMVLARAVGAFRHQVGGLPVLGPASVALQLAGNGQLDALRMQVRPRTGAVLDSAAIIDPKEGAHAIVMQLSSLLGAEIDKLPEGTIQSQTMFFGYLDLGKRMPQRLLAPTYIAQIELRHEITRQAYVLVAQATEKPYMQLPMYGVDTPTTRGKGESCGCDRPG